MLLVSTACESSANFYFKINIMKCRFYKKHDECINHHNKTEHCKFAIFNQFDDCYYNSDNYQFCQK